MIKVLFCALGFFPLQRTIHVFKLCLGEGNLLGNQYFLQKAQWMFFELDFQLKYGGSKRINWDNGLIQKHAT